jgi:hypothetical protein
LGLGVEPCVGADEIDGSGSTPGADQGDMICGDRGTVAADLVVVCSEADPTDGNDTVHGVDDIDTLFGASRRRPAVR